MKNLRQDDYLRIIGAAMMIVGYFVLLYIDVKTGVTIRFFANIAMIPFAVRIRTWDIVALEAFFAMIDLSKFIHLSL